MIYIITGVALVVIAIVLIVLCEYVRYRHSLQELLDWMEEHF